ncbi:hypothetical protein MNBD_GAMMA12-2135 [hydrothermal vent metagenome]|uniref:Uncharacterized protein n=1 Tax=hydrothermal vent metagenome TaxID=652676 RepID=A0A3B0XSH5_9ZZZZ
MALEHDLLGSDIADWLMTQYTIFERDKINPSQLHFCPTGDKYAGLKVSFNLSPVDLPLEVADAQQQFQHVQTINTLISQYWAVRQANHFEHDIPVAMDNIHPWADDFLDTLMTAASTHYTDQDACLIAQLISTLDSYAAIKTIESLLNNPQDILLLRIAKENNWQVHLDHIAIRCGNQRDEDAERIFNFLMKHYHYYPPQHIEEAYLLSSEGWNAYPLYKIMNNGQVIRIIVSQADSEHHQQTIQHWNHAYGYTAHHIGLRLTQHSAEKGRQQVSLTEINHSQQNNIFNLDAVIKSSNLMHQVFLNPVKVNSLPNDILAGAKKVDPEILTSLKQGKLIELVSRLELPETLKEKWFTLYQIRYEASNPIHSVPAFNLFTPFKADCHYIKEAG